MSLKKILVIIFCLFNFSFSTFSYVELTISNKINSKTVITDNWVLEYHDNAWWWVLYDEDGRRIMEVPADF